MTNNYIKITTRTTRPASEFTHLGAEANAISYVDSNKDSRTLSNLSGFLPVNDRDPVGVSSAVSRAGDMALQCKRELGKHFRGCTVSVFRDYPGNSLPVVGGVE